MLTGWITLNLRDEPATKVRHRRDFDSQAVARGKGWKNKIKGFEVLRTSFSAQVRWSEPGAPLKSCEACSRLGGRPAVSHISQKTSETPRISGTQLRTVPRVRLSFRERRIKFREPTKLHRKSGGGAPGDWLGDRSQKPVHSSDLHSKDGSNFVKRARLPEDDASGYNHSDPCSGTRGTDNR
jgi:hypothetical protein